MRHRIGARKGDVDGLRHSCCGGASDSTRAIAVTPCVCQSVDNDACCLIPNFQVQPPTVHC